MMKKKSYAMGGATNDKKKMMGGGAMKKKSYAMGGKVVKGPYDPDVTPVTDNAILGFPAVPFALPIVTPAPAVSVLPNALPLFIATRPVIPVRSVIAFNADASAVSAEPFN